MGIGKVQFYASFGVLVGTWGNEASSSGVIAWAEVALRIKVFWVFSFGASVKATFEQLGPQEPNYRRLQPRGAHRDAVVAARRHLPGRAGARDAAARGDAGGLVSAAVGGGAASPG